MIIDDSDGFADLVCGLLAADGFDVVGAATDHEQGLRLVGDLCPDLVLVDLYLGASNGLELIADLVDSGLAERMFMILISSCPVEELSVLFECSAADAYLPKMQLSGDAVRDILRGNGHAASNGNGQTP